MNKMAARPLCSCLSSYEKGSNQAQGAPTLPGMRRDEDESLAELLLHVPERVDTWRWCGRLGLLAAFAVWGFVLIGQDHRTGEIGASFLHRPLLVFHEAGHVLFRFAGEWMGVLGGTLGQLIMPLVLGGALLWQRRDPFGAAIGLWLFGVSLLDVAPYMYDAWEPRLMLLSGHTGEEGFHDWIYLFRSMGLHSKARMIGGLVHTLGALVVLLSLAWAGAVLWRQKGLLAGDVIREE
jgi:hypothetical protein